jgi:hypothetical protein
MILDDATLAILCALGGLLGVAVLWCDRRRKR